MNVIADDDEQELSQRQTRKDQPTADQSKAAGRSAQGRGRGITGGLLSNAAGDGKFSAVIICFKI